MYHDRTWQEELNNTCILILLGSFFWYVVQLLVGCFIDGYMVKHINNSGNSMDPAGFWSLQGADVWLFIPLTHWIYHKAKHERLCIYIYWNVLSYCINFLKKKYNHLDLEKPSIVFHVVKNQIKKTMVFWEKPSPLEKPCREIRFRCFHPHIVDVTVVLRQVLHKLFAELNELTPAQMEVLA